MRFLFAIVLTCIPSQVFAEFLGIECEIKQHIIVREPEPVDGILVISRILVTTSSNRPTPKVNLGFL